MTAPWGQPVPSQPSDHRRRTVAGADDPAELPLGLEHHGRRPARSHLARLPSLDVGGGCRPSAERGRAAHGLEV